jgi:hypothetical protein
MCYSKQGDGSGVPAVRPKSVTKLTPAEKQRRYRLRQQQRAWVATGNARLYVECRECGKAIKPSYRRGFCPGGQCKQAFFEKVQVPHVIYLGQQAKEIAERVVRKTVSAALG